MTVALFTALQPKISAASPNELPPGSVLGKPRSDAK